MRGIVLAGGTGSRLSKVTTAVNKHCLLVHDRPMIEWPIQVLRDNGIIDITIVSTPQGIGQLAILLGSNYTYRVQDKPSGIAQALACAETCSDESVAVILGDNIFPRSPCIWELIAGLAQCRLYKLPREQLSAFGVPVFAPDGSISSVIEKPKNPPSDFAIMGLYTFGPDVFSVIKGIPPSARGEVEITDVLQIYANREKLIYSFIEGFCGDAGTVEGIAECTAACKKWSN